MPDQYLTSSAVKALNDHPATEYNYLKARQYLHYNFLKAAKCLCLATILELARMILNQNTKHSKLRNVFDTRDDKNDPEDVFYMRLVTEISYIQSTDRSSYVNIWNNHKCINEIAAYLSRRRYAYIVETFFDDRISRSMYAGPFDTFRIQDGSPCYTCAVFFQPDGRILIYLHRAILSTSNIRDNVTFQVHRGFAEVGIDDTRSVVWDPEFETWTMIGTPISTPNPRTVKSLPCMQKQINDLYIDDVTPFQVPAENWHMTARMYVIPVSRALELQAARGPDGVLTQPHRPVNLSLAGQCISQLEQRNMLTGDIPPHVLDMQLPTEIWFICPFVRASTPHAHPLIRNAKKNVPWGYSGLPGNLITFDMSRIIM